MHYFVNKEHKGILLSHLPTNKNLWALFDIYGNTVSATFVPPGKKCRMFSILENLLMSENFSTCAFTLQMLLRF